MQKKLFIGILTLVVIAGGAYAIFHKSPEKTASTTSTTAAQTQTAIKPIIQTKSVSNVGDYLADSGGIALYTYGGDTSGVSNCSAGCLASWPAYEASGDVGSLPSDLTVITRTDGSKQYAYKGLPLYTFTGESAGQVTGDGVGNFHVAKP